MASSSKQDFDLHGHTKYSGLPFEQISYSPKAAVSQAKKLGLAGIAITGHDTVEGVAEAMKAGEEAGIIVVPGIEVTCWNRWRFRFPHILALGISPNTLTSRIPSGRSPHEVINWIHAHKGLAIISHPSESAGVQEVSSLNYEELQSYLPLVDGVEGVTVFGEKPGVIALAAQHKKAILGSSDFHFLEQIGLVRTRITIPATTWQDVITAITKRAVEAYIPAPIPPELKGKRPVNAFVQKMTGNWLRRRG